MRISIGAALLFSLADCRPSHSAPVRLVYEFPNGTWIENIAVRGNGDLLLTSLESPGGLTLLRDPLQMPSTFQIDGFEYTDTLGIVETQPDVFHVLSSNFSLQTVRAEPGSNAVWRVDFNTHRDTLPSAVKAVDLPDAAFLNGLTAFNDSLLLAADSVLGVVWAVDLLSNTSWIAADDNLMKPVKGQPYLEGINGLHIKPSYTPGRRILCFANSQQYVFACLELDAAVRALAPAQIVARPNSEKGFSEINWDDFAFDDDGAAFVATEKGNSVQQVSPEGRVRVVAGDLNSTAIAEPTAAAFGRGVDEMTVLYVVTAGGLAFPVVQDGQNHRTGAQVVAVYCPSRH